MSKKLLLSVLLLLIALSVAACSGNSADARKSTTVISVSDRLDYDENEWRASLAEVKPICLALDGSTEYDIIVPACDYAELEEDARYLADILRKMTGAADGFRVKRDDETVNGRFISLGDTIYAQDVSASGVTDDGYVVKTQDGDIFIKSLSDNRQTALNGVINGIYGFAEDVLGCMFVRDDYDYIPYAPTVYLDELDILENPDFAWRRVYQYEVSENGWSKRIRSNGTGSDSNFGNDNNNYWGTWCHSVFTFVPPEEYFDEHPEYFAYVKGKRRYEYNGSLTQLCLTNPDIYAIAEDKLAEFISEAPDLIYWDFSINDNMYYCECDECEASYEKYGSRAGALIEILNKLALRFPDKYISTLAYTYTKDVPEGIICEKNVNIVIAPIETSQLYSYKFGDTAKSAEAKKMIEDWGAICQNLFIWDYVVDFKNLLLPYPNFAVQKDNVEFYKENNVRSVFHQGSREMSDELCCLRSYILAKQLWDTDVDVNALLGKYLKVTYGEAAEYIAEYIDLMHESVRTEADDLDLYDQPEDHYDDYLSNENVERYLALTQSALTAAEGDELLTGFVEEIRINALYAQMYGNNWNISEKEKAFEEFRTLVTKHGVDRPHELTPPDMEEFINKTYPRHLALIKLYVSLCVIGGCAVIAGGVVLLVFIRKRRKKLSE